ncbi:MULTISPECIES: hypothetical protein [unclassified Caballeronia]|uniref:hypothetical protein n=1 Tax=unclassified Caballeronia TaxID=2646786 RepID=UPI002028AA95|nr:MULTISPECIES: hypothetical protein [unclassified Caballeronia]
MGRIFFEGRAHEVRGGLVYMRKLGKSGEWHWARAPHTYHRIIAAVLDLHQQREPEGGCDEANRDETCSAASGASTGARIAQARKATDCNGA